MQKSHGFKVPHVLKMPLRHETPSGRLCIIHGFYRTSHVLKMPSRHETPIRRELDKYGYPKMTHVWGILQKSSSIPNKEVVNNLNKKQVRRGTYRESENLLRSIDIW